VGQRLGVSRERARQLETRALNHLKFDDAAQALRRAG
jgi:DNA-directed RNA polymerase sigma subunit (sigma70/sigma32)